MNIDPLTPQHTTLELGHGITLIDTAFQRPNMAACYVMQDGDDVAIIETGTKDTVPLILEFLQQQSIAPEQVKYVIVTHVHLDHAGGAGRLMNTLPKAKLVVHLKGLRHMVNPEKLQAGATAVYGEEEFQKTYGDLLPIEESRTFAPEDNATLTLGQRSLRFIDSPGHARHHFCVFDELSKGFFTGDTFGLAYQELTNENGPFIFPTTTPVQFDPEAMKHSIERLVSFQPECMYLTHYGKIENVNELAQQLTQQVDDLVEIALSCQTLNGAERIRALNEKVMAFLLNRLEQHDCPLPVAEQISVLKSDVMLNAQGLDVWLSGLK